MSQWGLMTREYDSLHGAWQSPIEDVVVPLESTTFEDARVEAEAKFKAMPRYQTPSGVFPQAPRLVMALEGLL